MKGMKMKGMKMNCCKVIALCLMIAFTSVSCEEDSTVETNITLDKRELTIKVGKTNKLVATVEPEGTPVAWSSSNDLVASVDDEGWVTAVSSGTATITAKAGDKTATCEVTVAEVVVTLEKSELSLIVGDSETLIAVVDPEDLATTWSSADPGVATVDESGLVTAVSEGTTTISIEAGGKTASCVVTVKEVEITFGVEQLDLLINQTEQLAVTVVPSYVTVVWESSDLTVATVDNEGKVTGVNEGTAIITARVGEVKAECTVTVNVGSFDIYTVGYEKIGSYTVATLWKNDQQLLRLADGSGDSTADAIVVSGADIYVVGKDGKKAKLWKINGNQIVENIDLSDGTTTAFASGICLVGEDLYVSGCMSGTSNVPLFWKNGIAQDLPKTSGASTNCIVASGSDIYIGGSDGNNAVIWKNGKQETLYESESPTAAGSVQGICVANGHVYAAGQIGSSSAVLWTDGTMQTLGGSQARGVCVIGEDVYVVGLHLSTVPMKVTSGVVWKNGTQEYLYNQKVMGSAARAILPYGKSVYVVGSQYDTAKSTAKIWRNGEVWKVLTDGTYNAVGVAMFIVPAN